MYYLRVFCVCWLHKWIKFATEPFILSFFIDVIEANAVLVRGFGLYVWESGLLSVRMTQCYDRLFAIAIKMRSMGMDLAKIHPVNHY